MGLSHLGPPPSHDGILTYAENYGFSCALNASGWYIYNNRSGQSVTGGLSYSVAADCVEELNAMVADRIKKAARCI